MIAKTTSPFQIEALVFDAYGTLFDVRSVATTVERLFPGQSGAIAELWRAKQLEYSWLKSLMQSPTQPREDFAAVTAHALDYAAQALGLSLADVVRRPLLVSSLAVSAYDAAFGTPEPQATLRALHRSDRPRGVP